VIGCAIRIHRELGPGLFESAYQRALTHELTAAGIGFEREVALPIVYPWAKKQP
jgi:GxxExxY protein